MSIYGHGDPSRINCTVIQLYTESYLLKGTMVTQGLTAILSMLSILMTIRKIVTTVMVDRAFKEYLLFSYAVGFYQSGALALLQIILLTVHLVSGPCAGHIPGRLCHLLRISSTFILMLPLMNVALTVFRFLVLRKIGSTWKERIWWYRCAQCGSILIAVSFQVYKYYAVNMTGRVPYCIGNFPEMNQKLLQETTCTSVCEAFSIIFSACLFYSYKKSDRSFEVNCSLLRRQAIETFYLFIPFSCLQAATFWIFLAVSTTYRNVFGHLPEPKYSAGSGIIFLPMYYTMFSPWLVYFILRREENKRIKTTSDLLARERNETAGVEYFAALKAQWGEPPPASTKNEQTTPVQQLFGCLRKKKSTVHPSNMFGTVNA